MVEQLDRRRFLDRSVRAGITAAAAPHLLMGSVKAGEKDDYKLVAAPKELRQSVDAVQDDIAALRAGNYELERFHNAGIDKKDDETYVMLVEDGPAFFGCLILPHSRGESKLVPMMSELEPREILQARDLRLIDGRLTKDTINVFPLLYPDWTDKGLVCYVADATDPRKKCIRIGPFELAGKEDPKNMDEVIAGISKAARWLISGDFNKNVARIPPNPEPDLMAWISDEKPSDLDDRRLKWESLFPDPWESNEPYTQKDRAIRFTFMPSHRERELRYFAKTARDLKQASKRIQLTPDIFRDNGFHDLYIQGDPVSIYPLKTRRTEFPKYDEAGTRYELCEGNNVRLYPKPVFTEDFDAPDYVPLTVDMGALGFDGGKHNLYYFRQWKPVAKRDGFYFYSDASEEVTKSVLKDEKVDYIIAGINRANMYFETLDAVNKVRIVDYNVAAASFSAAYPDVINITDEWVKENTKDYLLIASTHETLHAMDNKYKITEGSTHLSDFYEKNKDDKEFNDFVREKNFYGIGGRPEEHVKELFASFIHSFMPRELLDKLDATSDNVRGKYLECLNALEKSLKAAKGLPEDSAIYPRIREI